MKTTRFVLGAMAIAGAIMQTVNAQESVCAEVVIEIAQELTLERQGFDAHMRISNDSSLPISEVDIDVVFKDVNGNLLVGTSDPNQAGAHFYIRTDTLSNINDVNGAGAIAASRVADIHWLIIPSPGAGGTNPEGVRYYIGAKLKYRQGGEEWVRNVIPDSILVKPMPELQLDYFLPENVYGDDAFTEVVEPPVPFPLGVRVKNVGAGTARALKIRAAQPRIVDNAQGLLVGFEILGGEVYGQKVGQSLQVDFGSIAPARAKSARWMLTCSLSGRFIDFDAYFKHADELGGELTSLIRAANSHLLVRDVVADLPGRDEARDFLARQTNGALYLYESDAVESVVSNVSDRATVKALGETNRMETLVLTVAPAAGALYAQVPFPTLPTREILRVVRKVDGKVMNLANVWQFRERRKDDKRLWNDYLALFDMSGGGDYEIITGISETQRNDAPVLQRVGRKVVCEGESMNFVVQATDPNGTTPLLSAIGLPDAAGFEDCTNGTGRFSWSTQIGDYGVHPVRFVASDGQYTDSEIVKIYVGHVGEPLNAQGIPESLADWTVAIKDLLASTSSGSATVVWETAQGVLYEVLYSDNPIGAGMTWRKSGVTREGTGAELRAPDTALSKDRDRRYYQVVIQGDDPRTNNIWGVIRRDARVGYTMISPPVRMDRRFDGELGAALAEEMMGDDGGVGDGIGDEVYILGTNMTWLVLYLDGEKVWRDTAGQPAAFELPAGSGFWVARKTASNLRITFRGPVGNDGTRTNRIATGWNILGLSEGVDLPLKETFAGAEPLGGACEEAADQLVLQKPDGSWRRLMYVDGWGAPYDGNWFDLQSFTIVSTNEVLEPGQAYYYLRRGGGTEVEF